jgi:hypothetical protein
MNEHLRNYQAGNRLRTVEKIETAMAMVEAELTTHGYYPENGGRLNRRELFRRAGLGESTLKNRTHAATASKVDVWLKRLRKRAPTRKPDAEDAKQARIAGLAAQVERIAWHYNEFKIEYEKLQKRNAELEGENAELRRQIAKSEFVGSGNPGGQTVQQGEKKGATRNRVTGKKAKGS